MQVAAAADDEEEEEEEEMGSGTATEHYKHSAGSSSSALVMQPNSRLELQASDVVGVYAVMLGLAKMDVKARHDCQRPIVQQPSRTPAPHGHHCFALHCSF